MVKEGAGAHQGWCNVMCTIKKLGLDCLVGFSFFWYPIHFGNTLTLVMQKNCSVLKPVSSFLDGE